MAIYPGDLWTDKAPPWGAMTAFACLFQQEQDEDLIFVTWADCNYSSTYRESLLSTPYRGEAKLDYLNQYRNLKLIPGGYYSYDGSAIHRIYAELFIPNSFDIVLIEIVHPHKYLGQCTTSEINYQLEQQILKPIPPETLELRKLLYL